MPLPTIPSGNVASATAAAYEVANSCLFDAGSDAYMHKTPSSSGNTGLKKFTFSTWVKRCGLTTEQTLIRTKDSSNVECKIGFDASGELRLYAIGGSAVLVTSAKYRDPSAWMHVVFAVDTTQGTAANRIKLYVNGTQVTAFGTETYPSADADMKMCGDTLHIIGGVWTDDRGGDLDAYLAETVLLDGTAASIGDLGEFDSNSPTIWKPKDVSGLTFGTNGFYLDYEDSSNLGNDANGGTDLTESGIAATDQAVDSPTNNWCVINPLDNEYAEATLTEGNCNTAMSASKYNYITSTFGLSKGKWYFEAKLTAAGGTAATVGIAAEPATSTTDYLGGDAAGASILYQTGSGNKSILHGTEASYGSTTITTNDILGIYIDLDNNKAYGSVNGTLQSSTGLNITAPASTSTGFYFPAFGDYDGSDAYTFAVNFGGCPAFSISSGNTDDNDYGNFEYSPNITGDGSAKSFYAICSKNLGEFGG